MPPKRHILVETFYSRLRGVPLPLGLAILYVLVSERPWIGGSQLPGARLVASSSSAQDAAAAPKDSPVQLAEDRGEEVAHAKRPRTLPPVTPPDSAESDAEVAHAKRSRAPVPSEEAEAPTWPAEVAATTQEEDAATPPPQQVSYKDHFVTQGGNRVVSLVVWVHFHASGGKAMCEWARRAHQIFESGVKLAESQLVTPACNILDPDPPEAWLKENLRTCKDLREFSKRDHGTTWLFLETPLDVKPPCPGVSFITVIREPWYRMDSVQRKLGWFFPNATAVMKSLHKGADVMASKNWYYCPVPHAPTCNGFYRAGYFDNFLIRFLLGSREGAAIPYGLMSQGNLERAQEILEAFDLVIPLEFMADALSAAQCAAGARYDLGVDGTPGGQYEWPPERSKVETAKVAQCQFPKLEVERMEFCLWFAARNQWDRELYTWVVARWQNWRAGRCRGGEG